MKVRLRKPSGVEADLGYRPRVLHAKRLRLKLMDTEDEVEIKTLTLYYGNVRGYIGRVDR